MVLTASERWPLQIARGTTRQSSSTKKERVLLGPACPAATPIWILPEAGFATAPQHAPGMMVGRTMAAPAAF